MGRHMIENPETGRRVFKTGAIGQKIMKKKKKGIAKSNPAFNKKLQKPKKKKTFIGFWDMVTRDTLSMMCEDSNMTKTHNKDELITMQKDEMKNMHFKKFLLTKRLDTLQIMTKTIGLVSSRLNKPELIHALMRKKTQFI